MRFFLSLTKLQFNYIVKYTQFDEKILKNVDPVIYITELYDTKKTVLHNICQKNRK